jgi:hypothetical protein
MSTASISALTVAHVKVIYDISGKPYPGTGVSNINATVWANNAVSWYSSLSSANQANIVAIEILNEPGGDWFWGSNALSTTNAAAYANLLKTVHNAFVTRFGSNYPKLLASYDGGHSSSITWGQEVWAADPNVGSYIDGITMHSYGGSLTSSTAATGNRANVTTAHNQTGKPVYITEVGWETNVAQQDGYQFTEQQQAENIYNFVNWARGTGYVNAVTIFGIRDFPGNFWGVDRENNPAGPNGSHKPSYYALQEAARQQPLTCSGC